MSGPALGWKLIFEVERNWIDSCNLNSTPESREEEQTSEQETETRAKGQHVDSESLFLFSSTDAPLPSFYPCSVRFHPPTVSFEMGNSLSRSIPVEQIHFQPAYLLLLSSFPLLLT